MKIHIIGSSGSGKSYFAEKLSKKFNIPHYDLDDIEWKRKYDIENEPETKEKLLNEILKKDNWIMEGVYHTWCTKCFQDADRIYILNTSKTLCKIRILRRFFRRLFKIEKGEASTFKDALGLFNWIDEFHDKVMPEIRETLSPYKEKIFEVRKREIS